MPRHAPLSVEVLVLVEGEALPVLKKEGDTVTRLMPAEQWEPIMEKIAERVRRQNGGTDDSRKENQLRNAADGT